jgi:hypothetical protein
VKLTISHEAAIDPLVWGRYDFLETRNAAAILESTNPVAFGQVVDVLRAFSLERLDITEPGKNKSRVPRRLDRAFREAGWREGRYDSRLLSTLRVMPYRAKGERAVRATETEVLSEGYKIDNIMDRVALDVEWHAKDGNLDRDLAAYRALYDSGIIDVGVIITRSFGSIRGLSIRLGRAGGFNTTTTTTIEKLEPRLQRGDAGGCPVLGIAITDRCFDSSGTSTA